MSADPYELVTIPDLDAHGLLKRIYQDPSQSVQVRMRAAQIAIE
jgi:hypothetical protein